jgi:4-hydroxy-4-methyl-2-oxoglutarate aldolase
MNRVWQDDEELFMLFRRELFTAVVGDVLDTMGYRRQFLPPDIRPVADAMVVVGRAMPVLEIDVYHEDPEAPLGEMFAALDGLRAHEVYVATGGPNQYALWGELMSTRAQALGAAGVVLGGYVRDTRAIRAMEFACFARGSYAQDQRGRGRVIAYRTPIEIGQARIEPGDIVFGDVDGVLVVPKAVEKDAVIRALEKVRGENTVREAIRQNMSATEAWRRFGIL